MKTFKNYVNEMIGPMGGDQRNMRGSSGGVRSSEKFDGARIQFEFDPDYGKLEGFTADVNDKAEEAGVQIEIIYYNTMEINGKKGQIINFLKSCGYKPREYKEYF